jgi:hypothetical protein
MTLTNDDMSNFFPEFVGKLPRMTDAFISSLISSAF